MYCEIFQNVTVFCRLLEPWLRRSSGAAREPQGSVPHRRHDGARPSDHHARQAGVVRFPGERAPGQEVLRALQALRGTTLQTGGLVFSSSCFTFTVIFLCRKRILKRRFHLKNSCSLLILANKSEN